MHYVTGEVQLEPGNGGWQLAEYLISRDEDRYKARHSNGKECMEVPSDWGVVMKCRWRQQSKIIRITLAYTSEVLNVAHLNNFPFIVVGSFRNGIEEVRGAESDSWRGVGATCAGVGRCLGSDVLVNLNLEHGQP